MCLGSPKTPEVSQTPSPSPIPSPSDISPQQTAEQRASRINALRSGFLSTIKTTPQGLTGTLPDLNTPVAAGQLKDKIGQ